MIGSYFAKERRARRRRIAGVTVALIVSVGEGIVATSGLIVRGFDWAVVTCALAALVWFVLALAWAGAGEWPDRWRMHRHWRRVRRNQRRNPGPPPPGAEHINCRCAVVPVERKRQWRPDPETPWMDLGSSSRIVGAHTGETRELRRYPGGEWEVAP